MLKFILILLSVFVFALHSRAEGEDREVVFKDKVGMIKINNKKVSDVTSSPYRFYVDVKCKGTKKKVHKVVESWPNCAMHDFNWDEMSKKLTVTLGYSAYENSYRKCIKRDTRTLNLKEFCDFAVKEAKAKAKAKKAKRAKNRAKQVAKN